MECNYLYTQLKTQYTVPKAYAFLAIQPIVAVAVTEVVDCPGATCCHDFPSHFREMKKTRRAGSRFQNYNIKENDCHF